MIYFSYACCVEYTSANGQNGSRQISLTVIILQCQNQEDTGMSEKRKFQKVGLLTYHHTTNFGSLLQTYALYKAIQDLGFDCEVIDYRNSVVEAREFRKRAYQCRNIRELKDHLQYSGYKKKKAKEFLKFIAEELKTSKVIYSMDNIDRANDEYDCFLVGSDLVWDFSINGHDTTYMLDFVSKKKKKIAYASSVGAMWKDKDRDLAIGLLNQFDAIGVREQIVCDDLKEELKIPVDFVCDPTMLFSASEWDKLSDERLLKEDYIICYMADNRLSIYKDAVQYGIEHGIPVYLISYDWVPDDMKPIRPYKAEEFLSLIRYADTIFTASYHGMLFSLYFEKNFYYYNRGWKARMESVSRYLGLEDREHWKGKDAKPLNYQKISPLMEALRKNSFTKLKSYFQK